MSIATTRDKGCGSKLLRITTLVVLIATLSVAHPAQAQLLAPITLKYAASVPIVKVVPNSCTGGYVLVKGTTKLSITTVQGGEVPFTVAVSYTSSGTGQDALADGTLVVDGSQKANYAYSSQMQTDAGFPSTPQDFMQGPAVRDYLVRSTGDGSDQLLLDTAIELTFTNGIPTAAVLQGLSVACSAVP
jgi:predicted secreted protein